MIFVNSTPGVTQLSSKNYTRENPLFRKGSPIGRGTKGVPDFYRDSPPPSHIFWWSQLTGRHVRTLHVHHIGFDNDTEVPSLLHAEVPKRKPTSINTEQHRWGFVVHGPADLCRSEDSTVTLADTW